ncbi:MAG: hypothetical protein AAGF90_07270 [Pseudomonadota bacterium]
MTRRLILHIGMHKTGATSIQRFLSRNRLALRALGVLYPRTRGADGRREPKHNALFHAISHEADHGAPHPRLGPSAEVVDALSRRIEGSRAGVAVLSAEGLSGERPVFARALAPLAGRFETRVVVFLRRPDRWVESFYRQMVMSDEAREWRSLSAFVAAPETQAHLDYAAILGWWAEAFGTAALRVGRFAPESDARTPTELFLKAAGLPEGLARLPYGRVHANAAATADIVRERLLQNLAEAQRKGVAPTESPAPTTLRLSDDDRENVLLTCADGLAFIRATYPLAEEGPLFA